MSQEMDSLKAEVTAENTVIAAAVAAFNGLAAQITDAAGDRAASMQLASDIKSNAAALAAAIPVNTPAATP